MLHIECELLCEHSPYMSRTSSVIHENKGKKFSIKMMIRVISTSMNAHVKFLV